MKKFFSMILFSYLLLQLTAQTAMASSLWPVTGKIIKRTNLTRHMFRLSVQIQQPQLFGFKPAQWCFLSFRDRQARPYSVASSFKDLESSAKVDFLITARRAFDEIDEYGNKSLSEEFFVSKPGEDVCLSGPMGHPFRCPKDKSKNLVFVAKGSGAGPVISILESIGSDPDYQDLASHIHLIFLDHKDSPEHDLYELFNSYSRQIPDFSWQLIRRDRYQGQFDSVCDEIKESKVFSEPSLVYVSGSPKLTSDLKKSLKSLPSEHSVYGEFY